MRQGDLCWAQLDQVQVGDLFLPPSNSYVEELSSQLFPGGSAGKIFCKVEGRRGRSGARLEAVCLGTDNDVAQTIWQWICRQKRVCSLSGSFCGRQVGRFSSRCHTTSVDECERRGKADQAGVQRGQVSRARQEFVVAELAPKDQTTLNELRGRRPQELLREISADVIA